ncbi:MAG: hypothetical protein GW762_02985 [Candidatus Pacebacteria bacterium]|nr:hypothetical protein [Candidatus Paceibacterota bacterium]PIR63838.1 MAG: hypothetical protein COU64_02610 [Candidatus Pacebacteria bacterium CG10_big_fil_rev_8_21_14_0_10_40_26]PIZ78386.1 MAG: hypothetical protein COY01_06425 [Candidatus Pacebacteria bacterium CG_4_10_14_0_2_um_filter_40_20]PJA68569.1 MAG: hypothetical protein CO156_03620 [Candidatus Pacebacteria bacterium CG_4_9_14_3_um_filter_40_12]PJC41510.1 MAG: hypothetical protein CO041_02215 [Candidatus Pacebacteria bacterium CG_4_9_
MKNKLTIFLVFIFSILSSANSVEAVLMMSKLKSNDKVELVELYSGDILQQSFIASGQFGIIDMPMESPENILDGSLTFKLTNITENRIVANEEYDLNHITSHLKNNATYPFGFEQSLYPDETNFALEIYFLSDCNTCAVTFHTLTTNLINSPLLLKGSNETSKMLKFNTGYESSFKDVFFQLIALKISSQYLFFTMYVIAIFTILSIIVHKRLSRSQQ